MRILAVVARLLLGLEFTFFGLNGLFHFLHAPAPPPGPVATYMAGLNAAHLMPIVSLLQVGCGILFLAGLFVPLALVLIGPVIANILIFHLALAPSAIWPGLFAFVFWLIVFFSLRDHFQGIFTARA